MEIFNIDVGTRFHEIKKHQEFAAPVPVPLSVCACAFLVSVEVEVQNPCSISVNRLPATLDFADVPEAS